MKMTQRVSECMRKRGAAMGVFAGTGIMMLGGCCQRQGVGIARVDTPQVASLRIAHDVPGKTKGTLARLEYLRGAKFDAGFLGTEVIFEDQSQVQVNQSSGIVLLSGLAFVDAAQLPAMYSPPSVAYYRFWPIIRRRKVAVGAEGTKFLVQGFATLQSTPGGDLDCRVFKIDGSVVYVQTPSQTEAVVLKDDYQYAEVYLRDGGKYEIKVETDYRRDPALKRLVEQAERDMRSLQAEPSNAESGPPA
jgi:hypothetical protein